MKMKCEACKGKSGNKACKACAGAGYIQKMSTNDNEDNDMKKASEILKGLREVLDDDEAMRIVKGKIESGEAHDDLGALNLNVDELDAAVDAMKASLAGNYDPDDAGDDVVNKGGMLEDLLADSDGSVEIGEAFYAVAESGSSIAKGVNRVGYELRANHEVLAKGMLAMAKLLRDQHTVIKSQADSLVDLQHRQDQIAKAMGQPLPPRSVLSGATAVPAPYEGTTAKGGAGNETTEDPMSGLIVHKAAKDEFDEIIKGGDLDLDKRRRMRELGEAIAKCESGGLDPRLIAEQYKISVA